MPWRQETKPLSRARLGGLYKEWIHSVGMFCVVLTFFIGLSFILDPLFRTVPPTSPFHRWGEVGVFIIGLVFISVSIWDTLLSNREGYIVTVVVLCGFGILSAVRPLSVSGMILYVLVLIATFHPTPFLRPPRFMQRRKGTRRCIR